MTQEPSNLLLIGPGSVGLGVAVLLADAGHRVAVHGSGGKLPYGRLICRNTITDARFDTSTDFVPEHALILVKAYDLKSVSRQYQEDLKKCMSVLCLQNGLGILESLPGFSNLVQGILWVSGVRRNPNETFWYSHLRIVLDERDGRAMEIGGILQGAGVRVEYVRDFEKAIFKKLVINIATNPLTAMYRIPNSVILERADLRERAFRAGEEVKAIAAALGVMIDDNLEEFLSGSKKLGDFHSSTLQDLEAGKPLEIQSILEEPLKLAERLDVPTPEIRSLYNEMVKLRR